MPYQAPCLQAKLSRLRPLRDGAKLFLIIFRIGVLYSPLKLFLPVSAVLFLRGCARYTETYLTSGILTNMSVLLWITAVITFLIGLVSEQITALLYRDSDA